jgi:hypothetical protein
MYYKACTNIFLSVKSVVFQTKLQGAQRASTVLVHFIANFYPTAPDDRLRFLSNI